VASVVKLVWPLSTKRTSDFLLLPSSLPPSPGPDPLDPNPPMPAFIIVPLEFARGHE
jgi:hypothetical protein